VKYFIDHRSFLDTKQRLRSSGENVIHVLSANYFRSENAQNLSNLYANQAICRRTRGVQKGGRTGRRPPASKAGGHPKS